MDELARRKKVIGQLTTIVIGANACGAVLAIGFFRLRIMGTPNISSPNDPLLIFTTNVIIIGLLTLGNVVGTWIQKPFDQWYLHPDRADTLTPQIQRLALQQPLIHTGISLLMWIIAGILNVIINLFPFHSANAPDQIKQALSLFIAMGGIAGPFTGLIIYFSIERVWQQEIPIFFPTSLPIDFKTFQLTIRRRLWVPYGIGFILLIIMATINYFNAVQMVEMAQPETFLPYFLYQELYLLGIGALTAGILAFTLGNSMADNIESLLRAQGAVKRGLLETSLPVTSNDELGKLTAGFNAMVSGLRQEEVIRRLFNLYVTPEVAAHAIEYGAERGGALAEATVLFSDIRGFTSLTEQMPPAALIALLNRYFQAVSATVTASGGVVNKFGGDSLLAIFGTPLNPNPDHARSAIQAAQEMLIALECFNADQRERGEPELRCGIGIASGAVVAGNIGSEERLEYTVIGDTVNLASRLQNMTKEIGVTILINSTTAESVADQIELQPLGEVAVRGKQAPVKIYGLKKPTAD